jgi:hypothetical protein
VILATTSTVTTVIIAVASVVVGVLLSIGASSLINRYIAHHASRQYKRRLESLRAIEKVLATSKPPLDSSQKALLWSEIMNLVMTARSEEAAKQYLERVTAALGDSARSLESQGKRVINERFREEACVVDKQ